MRRVTSTQATLITQEYKDTDDFSDTTSKETSSSKHDHSIPEEIFVNEFSGNGAWRISSKLNSNDVPLKSSYDNSKDLIKVITSPRNTEPPVITERATLDSIN